MRLRFMLSVGISDLLALVFSAVVASVIVFGEVFPWRTVHPGTRAIPMLALLGVGMAVISILTESMSGPGVPRPSYGRIILIVGGTLLILSLFLVFNRGTYYSRPFLAITTGGWLVLGIAHRIVRRVRPWTERIGVITDEKQLADDLAAADHAEVVWIIDPATEGDIEHPHHDVTIAVDLKSVLSEQVAQFVSSCDIAGYTVIPLSSTYEAHTGRVPLVHLNEGWEISEPLLQTAPYLPGKRFFDIVAVGITAPLWVPLGLLVGLFVKASSPGPAIFKQRRVGLGEASFTMYKFRTMAVDAEENGPQFAEEHDHRLIRGGRFLRMSRLDEIPQLWNVLIGDMSLVGPRAEQVPFVEEFKEKIPFYAHRHLVRPGVTGWAQVNYGYADDTADTMDKLTYDLFYIKNMSPVLDTRILWKSLWTVLSGAGAR